MNKLFEELEHRIKTDKEVKELFCKDIFLYNMYYLLKNTDSEFSILDLFISLIKTKRILENEIIKLKKK